MSSKNISLSPWVALWHALSGRDVGFYPRLPDLNGKLISLESGPLTAQLLRPLKELEANKDTETAAKLARESLNEVKSLTDYQDGKATRLLTILTFLSAFSGVLFGKIADTYPIHKLWGDSSIAVWQKLLVSTSYLSFCCFLLTAAFGALITFYAIRTRFKFPQSSVAGAPKSHLFFMGIMSAAPENWSAAFLAENPKKVRPDLQVEYLKNYIVETYLVSAKLADKLKYLEPAQAMQQVAIKILIIAIFLFAATFALVPSPASNPDQNIQGSGMANSSYNASLTNGNR